MADNKFLIQTPNEIACYNDNSKLTVLQVAAPANVAVKVLGWSISFDGTSTIEQPMQVSLRRQITGGTIGSVGAVKLNHIPESVLSTGAYLATSEPTDSDLIDSFQIHPQAGLDVKYPEGEEPIIPPSGIIAITVITNTAVNCMAKILCEE